MNATERYSFLSHEDLHEVSIDQFQEPTLHTLADFGLVPSDVRKKYSNVFPEKLNFFREYWIDQATDLAYYTRHAYFDRMRLNEGTIPKWKLVRFWNEKTKRFLKSKFDESAKRREIEKHLDWQNYLQINVNRFKRTLDVLETAYWLGVLPGPYTRSDAIDLDSHVIVGYYTVPAQAGIRREIPVPKCDLRFFQNLKMTYDAFPDRIWMTTSGNLGKAAWRLHHKAVEVSQLEVEIQRILNDRGLNLEFYPVSPKSKGSLGKCHRRPFGLDSAIHTEGGVVSHPIDQIRYLMEEDARISWPTLFVQHIQQMEATYRTWEEDSFLLTPDAERAIDGRYADLSKEVILAELWDDVDRAWRWFRQKCPRVDTIESLRTFPAENERREEADYLEDWLERDGSVFGPIPELVSDPGHLSRKERRLSLLDDRGRWFVKEEVIFAEPKLVVNNNVDSQTEAANLSLNKEKADVHTDFFTELDSKHDRNSRYWSYIKELAQKGVPESDKLHEFLLDLAAPLFWREFYTLPEDERREKVFEDLWAWVEAKHNGNVTRLGSVSGNADSKRQIWNRINTVSQCGQELKTFFATMRENDCKFPHRYESLSALIRDLESNQEMIHYPSHCKSIHLSEPNAALPESVEERLCAIVKNRPKLVLKGKSPFLAFSREFLSKIWEKKGQANLSKETLNALAGKPGAKDRNQVLRYKKLLAEFEIIEDDWESYAKRGVSSCLYRFTPEVQRLFEEDQD